jgi:hypothetical protein
MGEEFRCALAGGPAKWAGANHPFQKAWHWRAAPWSDRENQGYSNMGRMPMPLLKWLLNGATRWMGEVRGRCVGGVRGD